MSPHRQKMIEAVCLQANKLYRLWIARNPDFEKNGRVHIIGHSVGQFLTSLADSLARIRISSTYIVESAYENALFEPTS